VEKAIQDYEGPAEVLKALGHPLRLKLLARILEGEFCVQDLGDQIDASQPATSQHLAVLRACGLVVPQRRGRKVCYRAADPGIEEVLRSAQQVYQRLRAR